MPGDTLPARLSGGWLIGAGLGGVVLLLATLPGFVPGPVGQGAHAVFASVCHQSPERSFVFSAGPLALCHRCMGLLVGLIVGFLVAPFALRPARGLGGGLLSRVPRHHRSAVALLVASIPTGLDWALGASGLIANTPFSRTATGLILGAVAGLLIAQGLVRPIPPPHPHILRHA